MIKGFTCGAFYLFNAGHVLMLHKVKRQCHFLIVGLQTNPAIDRPEVKNVPVQSLFERTVQLKSCKFIDKIIVYETEQDLEDILDTEDINKRFIGMDHKDDIPTGSEICKKRNIEIIYLERGGRFSTSELRERVKNA